MKGDHLSLQLEINELSTNLKAQLPPDVLEVVGAAMEQLIASGIENEALGVGATASNFGLINALDENITLYEACDKGPVILKFYRGNW